MTEEQQEEMEVSGDFSALAQIDERDKKVKESVVAYLMWHSGEVLDKTEYPNRDDRAEKIDELGRVAIARTKNPSAISGDSRRILATQSIATQARESRAIKSWEIICYLDAETIMSGAMIPTFNLDNENFNLTTPEEMQLAGFTFKDFSTFRQRYNDLGTYLITDPTTVMTMLEHLQALFLEKSITNYHTLSNFHTIVPHWNIVGAPEECKRTFENLSLTYDTGKLTVITGQVSEVGDCMTVYTKIAFRCRSFLLVDGNKSDIRCNTINLVAQHAEEGVITKPSECEQCGGKDFMKLASDKSRTEPVQRIQLQELDISEEPKAIMVELRGNLVKQVTAGSTVELTGYQSLESITKNSLMATNYFQAQSIRTVSNDSFAVVVDEGDVAMIEDWVQETPDISDRMLAVHSAWIGHLLCPPKVKEALVLQAVGAPKETTSMNHRSGIHIMIAGDPGTAKTKLLEAIPKILPQSRYVSADTVSTAGLTGACSQVEDLYTGKKRWAIIPGALALTPREAICCVDEFNLYKQDLGDFNNAMESGKTTINKIVKGTVYTECSVLAGANPKAGVKKKFSRDQDFSSQLGLDITVMQRFDAIFILLDDANERTDEDIAMSMLGYGTKRVDDFVDLDFIVKYLAHAKTVKPTFTREAAVYISKQHSLKRQQSKASDYMRSHRQVASLKRFSIAAARFDLSETVGLQHVMFAESILEETLNEQDPGVMVGAAPKESREFRALLARKIVEFMTEKNAYENIDPEFVHAWMTDNDFAIEKSTLISLMDSFCKNAETKFRKTKNGNYEYDGSQNPAYSMW